MIFQSREDKRRDLRNALVSVHNVLSNLINKPDTWDNKMKAVQEIQKILPFVIRYMWYFKNTEGN